MSKVGFIDLASNVCSKGRIVSTRVSIINGQGEAANNKKISG